MIFENIFGRRKMLKVTRDFKHERESPRMAMHREIIMKRLEDLLKSMSDVIADKKMDAKDKYAVVTATLYASQMTMTGMIEEETFFNAAEFDDIKKTDIHDKLFGDRKEKKPNYIG